MKSVIPDKHARQLFRAISDAMPLHAEEGSVREVIPEADLIECVLVGEGDREATTVAVAMVRRLFAALRLLEQSELLQARWAFASFPASLLARSILETLATDEQGFFDPDYWSLGDQDPTDIAEEQRALLRRLEMQRCNSSPNVVTRPIRTVHVAFGMIRLGGRFLLHAREDRPRSGFKRYVLPGGKLKLEDLPLGQRAAMALRHLAQIDSSWARQALATTLARELKEELSLLPEQYTASLLHVLAPFNKIEGAKNTHTYTQYDIHLYTIRLTPEGELTVLDEAALKPDYWSWFDSTDLASGQSKDGRGAFVDALMADFGDSLETYLRDKVPDSSTAPPAYCKKSDAIELPAAPGRWIVQGETGREEPSSFSPNRHEWELLMLLGWQARRHCIRAHDNAITPLGAGGWLKLDNSSLRSTAQGLARKLEELQVQFIELDSLGHCRLSVDEGHVYFSPECFDYQWHTDDPRKRIRLALKSIETSWATLEGTEILVNLAPKFAADLRMVEDGGSPEGDFEREARRLFDKAKPLGLRKFISSLTIAGVGTCEIVVPQRMQCNDLPVSGQPPPIGPRPK